jgi:linoleoyl-CoA desaturase
MFTNKVLLNLTAKTYIDLDAVYVIYIYINFATLKIMNQAQVQVKFNSKEKQEFFVELGKRVNNYFKDNNITRYANTTMKVKTAFMLGLYFIPLSLMLFGFITTVWLMYAMWAFMGFGLAGIGLSIMHDANHGAYSQSPTVNLIMGYVLNLVGGYHVNWKIQHNVLHHSYTNVIGHDEDIQKGIMRFAPEQPWKKFHRFQIIYAPLLYSLMTLYWVVSKDFEQLARYDKRELYKRQNRTFASALLEMIITKAFYFTITVVLPLIILPFAWWQIMLGFLLMHFIGGMILALIFQPAHVAEDTEFYITDETGSVENNFAVHQVKTTANFANKSVLLSWFVGGLNFQIEHHLFPNICHVHYKEISKIVKATAKEFDLPYYEYPTFFNAVASHFKHLYTMGVKP